MTPIERLEDWKIGRLEDWIELVDMTGVNMTGVNTNAIGQIEASGVEIKTIIPGEVSRRT